MTAKGPKQLRVSLVGTPDAQVAPLSGLYETLNAFPLLASFERGIPERPFAVEIVGPSERVETSASGLPLGVQRSYEEVDRTDITIVPLMMVEGPDWVTGRYSGLVNWLRQQHEQGAILASACTGVLLLAETGLLAGREATIHWAFAPTFKRHFPDVRLRPEEVLVVAGDHEEFVMTGGVMSWHDLALHLIANHVGPTAAQAMARLLMLEWHGNGQSPYMEFSPRRKHDDALIGSVQEWIGDHYMVADPVAEMVARSELPRRIFVRRFRTATGLPPIHYVQSLRVTEARRRLKRTGLSVEEIAHRVGYENRAYFRRVFRRITRLTPAAYRRKFQLRRPQS